ncbi:MAG: pyrophosphatase PpaX [Clostridiaceae bacterium]
MIKAVMFDLDGTIADTNELIFKSFRHTFHTHGIDHVADAEIYSFFGEPLHNTMHRYAPDQAKELTDTYRDYNAIHHDELIRHFPMVKETLNQLIGMGLLLGIVTSKRGSVAQKSLDALNLTSFFKVIVTPELTVKHKPEPDPVLRGAELLGVLPNEAIMVGDSPYDLLAGRAAGCITCGVEYTRLDLNVLLQTNPDYMISDVSQIIGIIQQLNQDEEALNI